VSIPVEVVADGATGIAQGIQSQCGCDVREPRERFVRLEGRRWNERGAPRGLLVGVHVVAPRTASGELADHGGMLSEAE